MYLHTLKTIPKNGAKGIMIPLGSGVQILADIPEDANVVVDIGSRVQAEKTREDGINILKKRNEECKIYMKINEHVRENNENISKY